MNSVLASLEIMWKGMAAIFAVILCVYVAALWLNRKKKEK
jgi:hypothetical protein